MKLSIKNPEDFWAGVMFIGFGVLAIVVALDYPYGSAMRMGPGYFPTGLGGLMILVGIAVSAASLKTQGPPIPPFAWKPAILLSFSFFAFGWSIDTIGFVPALVGVIVLSAFAGKHVYVKELIVLTIVLVALALGVFVYGIELPLRLFWWS